MSDREWSPISAGDIVVLKSFGTRMTVSRVKDAIVETCWFDGGVYRTGVFPASSLILSNISNGTFGAGWKRQVLVEDNISSISLRLDFAIEELRPVFPHMRIFDFSEWSLFADAMTACEDDMRGPWLVLTARREGLNILAFSELTDATLYRLHYEGD